MARADRGRVGRLWPVGARRRGFPFDPRSCVARGRESYVGHAQLPIVFGPGAQDVPPFRSSMGPRVLARIEAATNRHSICCPPSNAED